MSEQTLTRYLLGELSEEEQAKIEEQLFTDDELFQQARALKAELTDNYVRGNLTTSQRKSYEQRFLTSPAGRNDVVFAKALTRALDKEDPPGARVATTEAEPSWWESFTAFFRVPAFGFGVAAAALLLIAGGVWWYQQSQRQSIEPQQANATRPSVPSETARPDTLSNPSPLPQTTSSPTPKSADKPALPTPSVTASSAPNTLLSVLLVPSLVRGENNRKRVTLPASTGRLQMQLDLDPNDKYTSYRAELRTRRGQVLLRQSKLVARPNAAGKAVYFVTPAAKLRNGDYDVILFGVTASGEVVEADTYRFTAVRQ